MESFIRLSQLLICIVGFSGFRGENWLTQFTDQLLNLMDHMGIEKAVVEGAIAGRVDRL